MADHTPTSAVLLSTVSPAVKGPSVNCIGLSHLISGINCYEDILTRAEERTETISSFVLTYGGVTEENEYLICNPLRHDKLHTLLQSHLNVTSIMLRRCLSSRSHPIAELEPNVEKRVDSFIDLWIDYFRQGHVGYRASYVTRQPDSQGRRVPTIYSLYCRVDRRLEGYRSIISSSPTTVCCRRSRLNDDPIALQAMIDGLNKSRDLLQLNEDDLDPTHIYEFDLRRSVELDSRHDRPVAWSLSGPIYKSY